MSENTCFNPKAGATVIEEIKKLAERLKLVNDEIKRWEATSLSQDKGEMIANGILSYMHLEDASMRLGKVIQAYDGGAKAGATVIREEIKKLAERLKLVNDEIKRWEATTPGQDKGEMIANGILSYRHLEDASMRLGKVIQAYDGGVSIYSQSAVDTPKTY